MQVEVAFCGGDFGCHVGGRAAGAVCGWVLDGREIDAYCLNVGQKRIQTEVHYVNSHYEAYGAPETSTDELAAIVERGLNSEVHICSQSQRWQTE